MQNTKTPKHQSLGEGAAQKQAGNAKLKQQKKTQQRVTRASDGCSAKKQSINQANKQATLG